MQPVPQRAVGPVPRIGVDQHHTDHRDVLVRELPRHGVQPCGAAVPGTHDEHGLRAEVAEVGPRRAGRDRADAEPALLRGHGRGTLAADHGRVSWLRAAVRELRAGQTVDDGHRPLLRHRPGEVEGDHARAARTAEFQQRHRFRGAAHGAGEVRGEPFACHPGPSAPPAPARAAGQLRDDRGAEVRRDVPAQHGAVRDHDADRGEGEPEDEAEDEPDRGVGGGGLGQGVLHRARGVHDLRAGDDLGRADTRLLGALVEIGDPRGEFGPAGEERLDARRLLRVGLRLR